MKKIKITMSCKEFADYLKDTMRLALKSLARIPYLTFVALASVACWLYTLGMKFCREHTKAAVIIGFVLCFLIMFVEFVYFKLQLSECSYQTSELIKRNYLLEQTDRYDIGFHDAMAKNKQMLIQCKNDE